MHLDVRRHMELFNPYEFNTPITVVGAGATGSWLTLFLAKLGITDITVYDFDKVEEHNVPNQAFSLHDVGYDKTKALELHVASQTGTQIKIKNEEFKSQRVAGIVFLMVDSMAVRKSIWENSIKFKPQVKLLIEPRMGLDMARIYNVDPMSREHIKRYEEAWYDDSEAEVSACGSSVSVITSAVSTASYCVRQLINFNAGVELDNEILVDYKYNNIFPTRW